MVKHNNKEPGLLLVANWDSNVGYAWWLMESFWIKLAKYYTGVMHTVLTYPSISMVPDSIQNSPIQVEKANFSVLSLKLLSNQIRFIRKHNIKVIYFSDKPTWSWVYLLYHLVGVKKIIVHDHTPGLRTRPNGFKRWVKSFFNRLPWISADGCIGATDYLKGRLLEIACVSKKKCFTVPNGISLQRTNERSVHHTFNIPRHRKVIVTAARANHYKGAVFAIEALAQVAKRIGSDNWHYVFCGDGPHLDEFRQAAKQAGLEANTTFPGRVEKVTDFFPSCSFAIHPSRGEVGYSLSILEYMWSSLPVIVPDNPSVCGATVDGENGLIYPEGDVAKASECIITLLQDPVLTSRLGRAAHKKVKTCFSLQNTHTHLMVTFNALISNPKEL